MELGQLVTPSASARNPCRRTSSARGASVSLAARRASFTSPTAPSSLRRNASNRDLQPHASRRAVTSAHFHSSALPSYAPQVHAPANPIIGPPYRHDRTLTEPGTASNAPGGGIRNRESHREEQRQERTTPSNGCPARRHRDDHRREADVLAVQGDHGASYDREAESRRPASLGGRQFRAKRDTGATPVSDLPSPGSLSGPRSYAHKSDPPYVRTYVRTPHS